MIVRGRGRPLLRGALVGGTAYVAGKRAADNAYREAEQNAAIADLQAQQPYQQPYQQQAPPPSPQPVQRAAPQRDLTAELVKLGEMVQQGLLTNEEFTAAKAKLLNG